ncbi:MAG: hypothetical protein GY896_18500 [Gammaproteobacteria bacterium]|nr:hypothetical protein [Gammaproteobacteria bacterium]
MLQSGPLKQAEKPPTVTTEALISVQNVCTTFGVLTVLCQDDVGGLQVENPHGEWIQAPPLGDTSIVNVGDLLERWATPRFARRRIASSMHLPANDCRWYWHLIPTQKP